MFHRLCGSPSIPLSFSLAAVVPRWSTYCVSGGTDPEGPTPSAHRLQLGLPEYLILFAPLAFAIQRQEWTRKSPSPLVFFSISTDFTLTPRIPFSSPTLKPNSLKGSFPIESEDFTPHLSGRLLALYTQ